MSKTKRVSAKHLPMKLPFGATVLTYLLYKSINPQGAAKGVVLTLFIGWLVIIWVLFIAQIWLSDLREPEWSSHDNQ